MSNLEKSNLEVKNGVKILDQLRTTLQRAPQTAITAPWLRQRKSSVINALLGEQQLIPTNCMRACTAVVTEISYNDRNESPYGATIEFVSESEWRKELELLLSDVEGAAGSIYDEESEAGIAFSKIKAVYPTITAHNIGKVTVEQLMRVKKVAELLGCNLELQEETAIALYTSMKKFIDSKEKNASIGPGVDAENEFWPMIRRVKVYTKASVLATGSVLVDLPGVADSNAARSAVARKYLQNCTALWVVAPIIRAVDDKSARHLLGEGFKRQLQRDGTLNRMTFICSKTDEIVLGEVRGVLQQDAEFSEKIAPIDKGKADLDKDREALVESLTASRASIEALDNQNREAILMEKAYRDLRAMAAKGAVVYPPVLKPAAAASPSKRPRSDEDASPQTPKKSRTQQYLSQTYQFPLRRAASTAVPASPPADASPSRTTTGTYQQDTSKPQLTPAEVAKQLQELKELRAKIRDEKSELRKKKAEQMQALAELKRSMARFVSKNGSLACLHETNTLQATSEKTSLLVFKTFIVTMLRMMTISTLKQRSSMVES
ncbi:hypothetical protein OHC33_001553 [Knufia fluminis]|uniref:Dynamin N-terminal domain-containing protein n=1 Tax=Knufia fluminis TaxID=191047 RepID=A0AAN8I6S0_9EURO|nr:hypothetical protein OHC33_001553 [Knufia fluminis]